ncbi:MAG: divergent polysaccharide deacetylase family protein [Emcibacter sp.]|nr:divergent polysaccharide deacetylase family protein [Emcibacter sp.]
MDEETPELTSITRRKTIRPLVAAWTFVIVTLITGFIWLSLSHDNTPTTETEDAHAAKSHDEHSSSDPKADVIIAEDLLHDDKVAEVTQPEEPHEKPHDKEIVTHNRESLAKAPIDGLFIMGANGPLPVLGPDSKVAWKEYAKPIEITDDRPMIAVIITGIGLNSASSDMAIMRLPEEIDMGFSPYGRNLQNWMDKTRQYGHESFLMIPTEPIKYPENDPGPHTLLSGVSTRDNLKKLDWLLSQVTGYVGVINEMGSKLTTLEEDMLPILTDLNDRGLMFLDSRSSRFTVAAKLARRISMPRAVNNIFIDNIKGSVEINQNLLQLENTARTYGAAIGVAEAIPLSITEIEKWSKNLEQRGLRLVPITAIANRQPIN